MARFVRSALSAALVRTLTTSMAVITATATLAMAVAELFPGLRLTHLTARSRRVGGVAWMGSFARVRRRSAANSFIVG